MNEQEFLKILNGKLKHLDVRQREEILADFKEHFAIALERGKSEQEISESLGDPKAIAKQYSVQAAVRKAGEHKSFLNVLCMIGSMISYKIGGGLIMGILYFVASVVLFCLFATCVGIMVAGMGSAVGGVAYLLSGSYIFGALGIFSGLLMGPGGILLFRLVLKLLKVLFAALHRLAVRIVRIPEPEVEG